MTQNKKNGFQLYKRLLNNTKIYKGIFSIAVIGMIIHALTDTSFAAIIKPLLDGSFIDKDPEFIKLMPLYSEALVPSCHHMEWLMLDEA